MNSRLYELVQERLYIGLAIKNYKIMCNTLEQDIKKGTKGKQYQFANWKRYFNWEKDGYKFIITEIYKEPLPEILSQGNAIYNKYIEKLILDMLVQKYQSKDEFNKRLYLSKNKILMSLNMVNQNYNYAKYNIDNTADCIKVDSDNLKEFYNINNKNLTDAIERALKRLSNKFLVNWQLVYTVALDIEDMTIDQDGNKLISEEYHRNATRLEREYIVLFEKEIAEEMGYNNKQEIYLAGKYFEFANKVCDKLREDINNKIKYYYKSYDIVFHPDVEKELENINNYLLGIEERENVKITLNGIVCKELTNNAERRQEKAKEDIKKIRPFIGRPKTKEYYKSVKLKRRIADKYLSDTDKIVSTVIKQKAEDLNMQIIKYNREQKRELEELNELLKDSK